MSDPRSDKEREREQRLKLLEDHIGQSLAESARNGELQRAPSFGKPLSFGDGYDETPPELRMAMKVLKDAGVVPAEVEALHRLAVLRRNAAAATDEVARGALAQQASDLEQLIRLRLERLARGSL
jgi:DNA-binding transcriptional ArsR family regulator